MSVASQQQTQKHAYSNSDEQTLPGVGSYPVPQLRIRFLDVKLSDVIGGLVQPLGGLLAVRS